MHFRVNGVDRGLPAFVLESGGGGFVCERWALIEQQLAPHSVVFSYDRAGIGASADDRADVAPAEVSNRLATLLAAAQIKKPFVLVGYSLGGLYAQYFAVTRSADISGLVLIDPTPAEFQIPRAVSWKASLILWIGHLLYRLGATNPSAALRKPAHVRTTLAELKRLGLTQAELSRLAPFTRLPVLCISAGVPSKQLSAEQITATRQSHLKLAQDGLAPWSQHHAIPGATHAALISDPRCAKIVSDHILNFTRQISP